MKYICFSESYSMLTPASTITSPTEEATSWKRSRAENSEDDSEVDLSNGMNDQVNHHNMLDIEKEGSDQASLTLPYMLDEKKSRPKRGKYRNYDRDALLKAVKAVQNGEMSVHRAGNFICNSSVKHGNINYISFYEI